MASKMVRAASHEAENQFELSLRQSFEILAPRLRPPFSLKVPDSEEYSQLNMALVYGVLSEPGFAKVHMKHLHAIVTDGYALFLSLLVRTVNELYAKLFDSVKSQLIWAAREMIDVSAVGIEGLLVSLLRQIIAGNLGDGNLRLCYELVSMFLSKWDCLLEEQPLVLTSALYTFLRLLGDHCRLVSNSKLETIRKLETEFCIKMLRDQFQLCLKIGRDLIRLLQDLVHVPEFKAIWKDLVLNPSVFKAPGFSDISQIYQSRTSSRYFLLRIAPEMETQLRFLLTEVKLGAQRRHQAWFAKKFLVGPESETLLIDIVRFICCGHHPSNEIIQSDIIPRWAVLGWLLKMCRKNYVEANVKLALFYDWLFFNERVDNIMNIEPAILLMVYSLPQYVEITHALLEYLFLLVDNFDVDRRDVLVRGVSSAFKEIVRRGVVSSLGVLTSCPVLSPFLKVRLEKFLSGSHVEVPGCMQLAHVPSPSMSPLNSQNISSQKTPTRSSEIIHSPSMDRNAYKASHGEVSVKINDSSMSTKPLVLSNKRKGNFESLVWSFEEATTETGEQGIQNLEAILLSFIDDQSTASALTCSEALASKIAKKYEMTGYKLFAPLQPYTNDFDFGDEVASVTALIIRTFCFSQHDKIQQMLLYWLRCGLPVGARILSYAARLAHEAYITGYVQNEIAKSGLAEISGSWSPLLKYHVDGHFSFLNWRADEALSPAAKLDKSFIAKLVQNAFSAYRCFVTCIKPIQQNEMDISHSYILYTDLRSCCEWAGKRTRYLLHSVFIHLSDLSIGKEDILRLPIRQLDHAELLKMQFEIRLKKYSVFGGDSDIIFNLIKKSLSWDVLEQHKFWGLLISELVVSSIHVEKILLEFFSCYGSELNLNSVSVEGLLTLLSSWAPTPELVGAIVLLPNNALEDFTSAILSTWAASNAIMLFNNFAKFLEKFESNNNSMVDSSGIMLNRSVIHWFLNHFSSKGLDVSDLFSSFTSYNLG